MTNVEASKLIAMLMAAFPLAQVPDGTVEVYESFLTELELGRAVDAVRGIIRTSKYFPAVADVVTAYEALAPRKPETGYRLFRPARVENTMPPGELKAAIAKALEAMK